jgi:Fe-S cluster assembly iron-binding protein IscA
LPASPASVRAISSRRGAIQSAAPFRMPVLAEEGKAESGLRVFVQGGGCSGFQYGLMIEEARRRVRPGVRVERREAVRRSGQRSAT